MNAIFMASVASSLDFPRISELFVLKSAETRKRRGVFATFKPIEAGIGRNPVTMQLVQTVVEFANVLNALRCYRLTKYQRVGKCNIKILDQSLNCDQHE